MNKYTEKQIEEKLKTLASVEPSAESASQMNQRVRSIISDTGRKQKMHSLFYYPVASAVMLLIGMSVLYDFNPAAIPSDPAFYTQTEPQLTLAKLNTVFNQGGQKALDEYFEKIESNRQPRTETITLQDIMKEL